MSEPTDPIAQIARELVPRCLNDALARQADAPLEPNPEVTRALLRGLVKGYTAGENTDAKHWRQRAESAEARVAELEAHLAQTVQSSPLEADAGSEVTPPLWDAFVAGWNARGRACYPDPGDGALTLAWRGYKAQAEILEARQEAAPQDWQPIESAPRRTEALFWLVPKSPEEAYHDSCGQPIVATFPPYIVKGEYGRWSSLSKATHWMPLPKPPVTSLGTPRESPQAQKTDV
jgi:hypothetical protein